ncbi:MAG: zf-HC2 domain-containing protein, partial [Acidimicrobiia bacterium]
MSCDAARGVLSATLDGEARPGEAAAAERHLDSCARCHIWLASAHRVNRALRLSTVDMVDRSGAILAEWDRVQTSMPRVVLLRLGLTAVAVVNIALAVVLILGSSFGPLGSPGEHGGRDMAAFPATLGAAFLLSAWDGRARGRLGVVAAAVVLLLISAVVDVAGDQT